MTDAETFSEIVLSEFSFLSDRGFRSAVESDESVLFEAPNGVFADQPSMARRPQYLQLGDTSRKQTVPSDNSTRGTTVR